MTVRTLLRGCLLPLLLGSLLLGLAPGAGAASAASGTVLTVGADVSWPNCPTGMGIPARPTEGKPLPGPDARFVVVGLTNGPSFTPNPCLALQVADARRRHLWIGAYAVATYPTAAQLRRYGGSGTLAQRLRRTGAAEAAYAARQLRAVGLRVPFAWVDVEPGTVPAWSVRTSANNALLDGVLAGWRAAGMRTGLYSYAYGWREITGGRRLALPGWVPAGTSRQADALAKCAHRSFSGGPTVIGQWVAGGLDRDVICPASAAAATPTRSTGTPVFRLASFFTRA